jgi:hypothetical protein
MTHLVPFRGFDHPKRLLCSFVSDSIDLESLNVPESFAVPAIWTSKAQMSSEPEYGPDQMAVTRA